MSIQTVYNQNKENKTATFQSDKLWPITDACLWLLFKTDTYFDRRFEVLWHKCWLNPIADSNRLWMDASRSMSIFNQHLCQSEEITHRVRDVWEMDIDCMIDNITMIELLS